MTINKLLDRIHILTPAQIRNLSDKAMEMITNSYEESLIRELIYQGKSNASQRIIVARIMEAFDKYYNSLFLVDRPNFLDYILLDLECGMVYTETGVKNENETEGAVKKNNIPTIIQNNVHDIDDQKKENEELKAKVETLQTKLKDAQEALDVYKNAKNINWHDKVRLELAIRIMEKADINLETYGNKAKAARILQAITKLPISTCSNYASNRDLSEKQHGDEIEKINSNLRALNKEIQL